MFPNLKMRGKSLKWIIVIVAIGSIATIVTYEFDLSNTCSLRQLDISGGVKQYEQTKNPELCDDLNNKISKFDDDCKSDVEELDCG